MAKEFHAEVLAGKHSPSRNINDTIKTIEKAREVPRSSAHRPTNRYWGRCFSCNTLQDRSFDCDGLDVSGKPVVACACCGKLPYTVEITDQGFTIVSDINPYCDVSLAPTARGAEYIPGQGHYIRSKAHLREFARANGMESR